VAAVALGVPSSISFVSLHMRMLGVPEHLSPTEFWVMGSSNGLDTVIPRVLECCMNIGRIHLGLHGAHRFVITLIEFKICTPFALTA
jgi:hypothetical protein